MRIYLDEHGHIVSTAESASIGALFASAKRRVKRELINNGTCAKFTVQVYWASPTVNITTKAGTRGFDVDLTMNGLGSNGISDTVYILCDGGSFLSLP